MQRRRRARQGNAAGRKSRWPSCAPTSRPVPRSGSLLPPIRKQRIAGRRLTGPITTSRWRRSGCTGAISAARLQPQAEINSGDTITIETLSQHASDDPERMITGDPGAEDVFGWTSHQKNVDRRGAGPMDASVFGRGAGEGFGVHICTGPIAVKDAQPGDVLEVRILDIVPRPSRNPQHGGTGVRLQRRGVVGLSLRRIPRRSQAARGRDDLRDLRFRPDGRMPARSIPTAGSRRPTRSAWCMPPTIIPASRWRPAR